MRRRVPIPLLLAVGLVAAIFRFGRLYWGLDDGLWFVDESAWVDKVNYFRTPSWASFQRSWMLPKPTLSTVFSILLARQQAPQITIDTFPRRRVDDPLGIVLA
jgi:hypothetical protein